MRYTTRQVESARTKVIEMENRAADQRRIVDELIARGQPIADERTQLAIMEKSLVQMRGFLQTLENLHFADQQRPDRYIAKHGASGAASQIESSADVDVLEAAEAVVHQHGNNAPLFCAHKMVDMLERGDLKKVATWLAIRHAARSLLEE